MLYFFFITGSENYDETSNTSNRTWDEDEQADEEIQQLLNDNEENNEDGEQKQPQAQDTDEDDLDSTSTENNINPNSTYKLYPIDSDNNDQKMSMKRFCREQLQQDISDSDKENQY